MKKKIFLMVAAILALCLTCGMLLVACNKGGNTGGGGGGGDLPEAQESWSESVATMNKALEERFNKNDNQFVTENGRKFVADFELELAIDDKTDKNADVSYKLIGKANINVDSFGTQFYLAVTENKEGYTTPKTLFGIGYEDIQNSPYFYFNINDGGYKKVNGFSLHQLMLDLDAKNGTEAQASEESIWDKIVGYVKPYIDNPVSIFTTLGGIGLLGEDGTRANYGNSFVYNINVSGLIKTLSSALNEDFLTGDLVKLPAETVKEVVNVITKIPVFSGCTDLKGVWNVLGEMLQYTKVSYRIDFADNSGEITGMGFTVNYIENDNSVPKPIGDYKLSLNKIRVDMGAPIADIFAGTGIDEVAEDAAINILKFSVDGKVLGYSSDNLNVPNKYYNIDIDMDLNPFKLMSLVGKATGEGANERIANAIKELGYINITIDEVTADNEFVKNILTLHSNTEEGIIVLGVTAHKALGNVAIAAGGVYDINELVNVIGLLVDKSQATSSAIAAADFDFNKVINIVKKVAGYFKYFNVANIVNNGVTVNAKDLVNQLFTDLTGKAPEGTVANAIASVLGSDVFNIKFSEFKYGECTEKETSTINLDLREDSTQFGRDAENISDSLIKQITSIGLEGKQITKGDSNLYDYMKNTNIGYDIYEMKGINLAGEEVTTSGFIFRTEGFDPNTVGKQNVKFYIAIANDFVFAKSTIESLGGITLNIDPLVPLYGVLVYETEIEVVEQSADYKAATLVSQTTSDGQVIAQHSNLTATTSKAWYSNESYFMGWGGAYVVQLALVPEDGSGNILLSLDDAKAAIIKKNGVDVTANYADGIIKDAGEYTITLVKQGYGIEIPITVTAA